MKLIMSLVRKESLHILRDRRTLLVVLIMPLVLLLLFGYAISTEVNNVRVCAVVDRHTDATRGLIERLRENPYFSFLGLTTEADVDRLLRSGEADVAVMMRADGDRVRTHIVADASNTVTAKAAASYVEAVMGGTSQRQVPVVMRTLYNPQLKSSYNFVPGILGMIFILICAIMTSVSIVSEKESGTMNLLLVSPARPGAVILGKLIPYFVLSCILLMLMLTFSYTLLGLPFSGNIAQIVLVSLLYIVLALSVGLLISTLVSTQFTALIVSAIVFMVPVIMLSGMLFPIDNMPVALQWLSCVVPARWYIEAMRKLMIQQIPLRMVISEVSILAGMAAAVLAVAIAKFNASTK